ncbi:MAG: HAD-IIIA family hydrolase [Phycisphaerales bacterium]|nr:HAD-IIIA family hydrolase [Phycisphaerales bacterium]
MPATPLTTPRPAIFLDRDDTINRNADLPQDAWEGVRWGDLLKPEFALLVPGVREALIALKDAGYALVVITNQGGVARAGGTMRDVDACNDRMRQLLAHSEHDDERVLFDEPLIDCWYSCPFHPKTGVLTHLAVEHEWRKPHCGMITTACAELNIDPARSWMVGDKQRDLDAAIAAGVPESQTIRVAHDSPVRDLAHAARLILELEEDPKPDAPVSSATLHPIDPYAHPLSDDRVRRTVESAASAIAERTGIKLIELDTTDSAVTATLATHKLGALAFMAELRRTTNRWHRAHTGKDLWPSANDPLT